MRRVFQDGYNLNTRQGKTGISSRDVVQIAVETLGNGGTQTYPETGLARIEPVDEDVRGNRHVHEVPMFVLAEMLNEMKAMPMVGARSIFVERGRAKARPTSTPSLRIFYMKWGSIHDLGWLDMHMHAPRSKGTCKAESNVEYRMPRDTHALRISNNAYSIRQRD